MLVKMEDGSMSSPWRRNHHKDAEDPDYRKITTQLLNVFQVSFIYTLLVITRSFIVEILYSRRGFQGESM